MRLNKKETKERGLTYAPITLLIIALPVVVVLGIGVTAAEVVRMKEKRVGVRIDTYIIELMFTQ